MEVVKKAIKIEIVYDDGSIDFAEGEAAEHIKRWYDGCEVMSCIHGVGYTGPKFEARKP